MQARDIARASPVLASLRLAGAVCGSQCCSCALHHLLLLCRQAAERTPMKLHQRRAGGAAERAPRPGALLQRREAVDPLTRQAGCASSRRGRRGRLARTSAHRTLSWRRVGPSASVGAPCLEFGDTRKSSLCHTGLVLLQAIVKAANILDGDCILEIGPGAFLGCLRRSVCSHRLGSAP